MTAWWPTRDSCCRPPWPSIWVSKASETHLDLGAAVGRANAGDKLLTLVASALAGGDCIDDANALRVGGTERILGFSVKAASTLGTFLRSFRWGHVRQLDRVSRELLARAWAAGAGPDYAPFTIDLDSTICETSGLAKEGGTRFTHTGVRRLPPAAGRRGRHGRRADGQAARRQRQQRSQRRPLPARNDRPCARRQRHGAAHRPC